MRLLEWCSRFWSEIVEFLQLTKDLFAHLYAAGRTFRDPNSQPGVPQACGSPLAQASCFQTSHKPLRGLGSLETRTWSVPPWLWGWRGGSGRFPPGLSPPPQPPGGHYLCETPSFLSPLPLATVFLLSFPSIFLSGICQSGLQLSPLLSCPARHSLSTAAVFWKVTDLESC